MVLYIGIYIESDWLYHAEWVALSNGQSGSELAEYSSPSMDRLISVYPVIRYMLSANEMSPIIADLRAGLGQHPTTADSHYWIP